MRDQATIKEFLTNAFWVRDNTIPGWNFDAQGNLSFGIRDYTDFPEQKYDPDIGIFGMDINVVLERPGHRISRRRKAKSKVGKSHAVSREESMEWFKSNFGINIMEEWKWHEIMENTWDERLDVDDAVDDVDWFDAMAYVYAVSASETLGLR